MGFGGVGAAAACCVLPLALASVGIGATGLAALGPLHTPLSAIAFLAVVAGWFFYLRKRRACLAGADCPPPARSTLALLAAATVFVALSALWPFIEAPLMALFE
jgi:mercuric ion transport protein